ncbi:1353_t:CDS:2 [Ambispora gerdemannii]|uniref:1353_t:CDS:1 n=1 Tax=Ambispora gerdemannii TaxID=144530 RepID=A0A9N9FME2_9GLOM|nr:1353_t:CDS:2 [Ambispora gerdemannii]
MKNFERLWRKAPQAAVIKNVLQNSADEEKTLQHAFVAVGTTATQEDACSSRQRW